MTLFADASHWLFFLGVALATFILLRKSWRRTSRLRKNSGKKKTPRRRSPRDGIANQPLADAPPEVLRWQVEMHETARELSAQLDSKIRILQQLTQTAESRIDTLRALSHQQDPSQHPSRLETIEQLASGPVERLSDALATLPPAPESRQPAGAREHVYALADLGVSTNTIADQLQLPKGDVEMLLSLRAKCS